MRREAGRRYALGPRLVRLGDVAGHVLGEGVGPVLRELVTWNLALVLRRR